MSYRKVSSDWIKGRVGRAIRGSSDAYTLAYYLMTAKENVKGLGIFWQPLECISVLFGIPSERLGEAFRKLQGLGFASYDENEEVWFVTESARHEWQEPPVGNPNMLKGAQETLFEQLELCRNSFVFKAWLERYGESWAAQLKPLEKGSGRLAEAFRKAFETPDPRSPIPDPDPEAPLEPCSPPVSDAKANGKASFAVWWPHYPKKVGRKKAEAAWCRLKAPPPPEEIIDFLERAGRTERWQEKQRIPDGPTFVNGERWEDDLSTYTWRSRPGERRQAAEEVEVDDYSVRY